MFEVLGLGIWDLGIPDLGICRSVDLGICGSEDLRICGSADLVICDSEIRESGIWEFDELVFWGFAIW